jgi:hypothetical protein
MKDFIRPSILSFLDTVDKNNVSKPESINNANEETTGTVEEEQPEKKKQRSRNNMWKKSI